MKFGCTTLKFSETPAVFLFSLSLSLSLSSLPQYSFVHIFLPPPSTLLFWLDQIHTRLQQRVNSIASSRNKKRKNPAARAP
ncbi:hypothetical protein BX666DRAFT_165346 [Dichotomocladium elegans]|nr:hypothetical protein BX666DRAFT_165346 [Dichotomocladium elegans]